MNLRLSKYRKVLGGGLLALLGGSSTAFADQADMHFAGFASIAYARTITDDKKEGEFYGMSNEGEYRDFNKLGFRLDADMKNNLSFTAQVLAQGADNYDPTFDWLFATYQIIPEVAITAGRFRVPVFMYSDFIDTSYAYQWIQPPKTIYNFSQTPFKSMEGLKLAYNTEMGNWTSELLVFGGSSADLFTEAGLNADLILDAMTGAAWTVDRDWLSLRAFYLQADVSLDLTSKPDIAVLLGGVNALEDAISAVTGGAQNPNFDDALMAKKDPGQFYGISTSMDFDPVFILAEASRIELRGKESNLIIPRMDSYYITAGIHLPAQWTLSLTYGQDKDYSNDHAWEQFAFYNAAISNISLLPITPAEIAQLQALPALVRGAVELQQNFTSQQTTLSARWDFHRSAALKFEFLHDERNYNGGKTLKPEAVRVGLDLTF